MRFPAAAILGALCLCLNLGAQSNYSQSAADYLEEQINANENLKGALVGVKVYNITKGETVISCNADKKMIPASTLKILSTGASFLSLGAEYRFKTSLGYDGEISPDGTLMGNLYIIGGADPSLGSRKRFAISLDQTYRKWAEAIENAGIRKIAGCIIGDDRFYSAPMEHPSWQWYDLGTYYGAGCSGLNFNENKRDFNVSAGESVGDAVRFELVYPPLYGLDIDFQATTGPSTSGNNLYLISTALSPHAEFRGTFAIDRSRKTEETANKFPAQTIAADFAQYLASRNIYSIFPARDVRNSFGEIEQPYGIVPADSLKIIATTLSPSLKTLARETNHNSNNVFADNFLRILGRTYKNDDSYSASLKAEEEIIRSQLGMDFKGMSITDGSGLSRQNLVTPDFLCTYLQKMAESEVFADFLYSLPSQGTGSLSDMSFYNDAYTICAKSGSMGGVRCYAGYLIPNSPDGETLCFAVMVNNFTCPSSRIRAFIYRLLTMF